MSAILMSTSMTPILMAHADTLEVNGQLGVGRLIDGVNLTGDNAYVSLSSEWSANNGLFVSLSCFGRENNSEVAIQRGCDAELGWFKPINDKNAITLIISRHDYSSVELIGWQYTDARLRWHLSKQHSIGLRASDSLLGQGFASATAFVETSAKLNDRVGVSFEAGYTTLKSNPKASSLSYALLGADYRLNRLSFGVELLISDSNYQRFLKLDVEQPEFSANLTYRFY